MVRFIPVPVSMNTTIPRTRPSSSKPLLSISSRSSVKAATVVPLPHSLSSSSSSSRPPTTTTSTSRPSSSDGLLPSDYIPLAPQPEVPSNTSSSSSTSISVPPLPSSSWSILPTFSFSSSSSSFRSLSHTQRLKYLAVLFGNLLFTLLNVLRLYFVTWLWLVLTHPVWNIVTSFVIFIFTVIGLLPRWINRNDQGIGAATVTPSMYEQLGMNSCAASTIYEPYWYRIIMILNYLCVGMCIGLICHHTLHYVVKTIQLRKQVHFVATFLFGLTILYYAIVMTEYTDGLCFTVENIIPFTGPITNTRIWYPLHYTYWFMTTPSILLLTSKLGNLSPLQRAAGVFFQWGYIIAQFGATVWYSQKLLYWIFLGLSLGLFLLTFRILVHSLLQVRILTQDHTTQRLWHILGPLALCLWCCYPTFWLLSSFSLITTDIEGIVWPLMDTLSKIIFTQLWISSDISMDIALDKQLFTVEQQRITKDTVNETKRAFMRYLFHELRIPLNSITLGIDEVQESSIDLYGLVNGLQQETIRQQRSKDTEEDEAAEDEKREKREGKQETKLSSSSTGVSVDTATEFIHSSQHHIQSLRATLDIVRSNTVAMTNLLDDFLSLERIEEGKWEFDIVPCDVSSMLEETVRMFNAPLAVKQLTVHVDLSSAVPPWFYGDMNKIKQVLNNYLSNAIKYSPSEGSIIIQVTMDYTVPNAYRTPQPIVAKRETVSSPFLSTLNTSYASVVGKNKKGLGLSTANTKNDSSLASYADTPNVSLVSEEDTSSTIHRTHHPSYTVEAKSSTVSIPLSSDPFATFTVRSHRRPSHTAVPTVHMYPTLPRDTLGRTQADPSKVSSVLPSKTYVPYIRFSVIDNGPGIAKDDQDNLFQPFYQVQRNTYQSLTGSGTGLGLSICKRIIELSGGKVGVHSSEGNGSTFYFSLPLLTKQESVMDGNGRSNGGGTHQFLSDPVYVPTVIHIPSLTNSFKSISSGRFALGNTGSMRGTLTSSLRKELTINPSDRQFFHPDRTSTDRYTKSSPLRPKIITSNRRTFLHTIDLSERTNDNIPKNATVRGKPGLSLFAPLRYLLQGRPPPKATSTTSILPVPSSSPEPILPLPVPSPSSPSETLTVTSIPITSGADVPLVLIHQGKESPTAASFALASEPWVSSSLPPKDVQVGVGALHVFETKEEKPVRTTSKLSSFRDTNATEQSIPHTTSVFVRDITDSVTNIREYEPSSSVVLVPNGQQVPTFSRTSYTPHVIRSSRSVRTLSRHSVRPSQQSRHSRPPSRVIYSKGSRTSRIDQPRSRIDQSPTIISNVRESSEVAEDAVNAQDGETDEKIDSVQEINNNDVSSLSSPLLTDAMVDSTIVTVSSFLRTETNEGAQGPSRSTLDDSLPTTDDQTSSSSPSLSLSSSQPRTHQPLLCCVIVDDVKSNRELFGRMLIRRGVTKIYYAEDGKDAIQFVTKLSPDERSIIQAWFIDNEMPHCDGYECTKQLRSRKLVPDHVPIIGVTGNTFEEDRQSFLRAGAEDVITKPINQQTLQQLLLTVYLTLGNPRRLSVNGGNKHDVLVVPLSPSEPAIYSPPIVIQHSKAPLRNWK